jgi:hypothetical protein
VSALAEVRYVPRERGNVICDLTRYERERALEHGKILWERSHEDGRSDRDKWSGFTEGDQAGLRQQQLGALAERVVAKALSIYWPESLDGFSRPDLPHNIEARLIGVEHYGLRVYPRNPGSRRVVGVVIPRGHEDGPYRIPGWILAENAKRPKWKIAPHGRPPMYCVPQPDLWPLSDLLRLIATEVLRSAERLEKWA